jgi:hypothetical protein
MTRLSPEQVINTKDYQNLWKVCFLESESGYAQDSWEFFYESYDEAYEKYIDTNKDNTGDSVPDYYIVAHHPEKVTIEDVIQLSRQPTRTPDSL